MSSKQRATAAGLAIHDLGGSPDSPVLVLVHANGDSAACWPDAARRWAPRFHVVAVDLRGHGASPRFTADQLAEPGDVFVADTVALLAELRTTGIPLAAVGHSLGGAALTGACAVEPDLLDAAVLVDPPWDTPVVLGRRPSLGAERRTEVIRYASDPEGELAALRESEPDWPDDERRGWIAAKAFVDLDYIATGAGRPSTPWTEHVPRITSPTLVVTGDDEVLVGPATRERIAELGNPRVEVVVLPGAGHYVRQQRTDAFHALVDPWLAEHVPR